MGEVIDLKFTIDGNKVIEPVNWQELKEVFEYGQNSNQPSIDSESFTFQGDSANLILDHFHPNGMLKPGNILVPLSLNVEYKQHDNNQTLVDDYVIDTIKGVQLNDAWFNNEFAPKEVVCEIRKKIGTDYFLTEIQGLTWGLLLEEGNVTSNDYTTVKTVVVPIYSFLDIVTLLLTLYSLQKQFRDSVTKTVESVVDLTQRISASAAAGVTAPLSIAVTVLYSVAIVAINIIASAFLLAMTIKIALEVIVILLPPVLRNKGITLRKGMEIITSRLGYEFVCDLDIIDEVVYMPSGAHAEGKDLIKDNLPNWFSNPRGVPNDYDPAYVCVEFVEMIKKLVNGRIDVNNSSNGTPTVYLRNEDDQSLFTKGEYKHRIPVNFTNVEYNLPDIPHTRLVSFAIDDRELYTTEYQENRMWEVKNISNEGNLPFTKGDYIDFERISLAKRKSEISLIEKIIAEVAAVADKVASYLGEDTKLEEKVKTRNIGCVMVSLNNFSNPKLVPIKNNKMPSNHQSILSAKVIEEKYYINRSIVRGTGQKLLLRNVEVPMSLADRDKIKGNGNFVDEYWGNCTFKRVEYQFSKDTAICDITVDNNYIASNTFTEKTYNGQEA